MNLPNSLTIARAYMQDHAQLIRGDILGREKTITHVFVDGRLFEPKQPPRQPARPPVICNSYFP